MKFWQTKRFLVMQRAWYQKLADMGFVDAEEMVGGEMRLSQPGARTLLDGRWKRGNPDAIADYYQLLRNITSAAEFDSEIDRVIMTMTADGARQKEIERTLNALGVRRPPRFLSEKRRCRNTIRNIVLKYERRWGLREDEREAG